MKAQVVDTLHPISPHSSWPEAQAESDPPAPVRLMLYSHDGFGLGHLRRNSLIAARFVEQVPGSTVLMLAGCPVGAVFSLPPGVDVIKLPSIVKTGTAMWRASGLRLDAETIIALRGSMILQAASFFMPHLVLVDYVPRGILGELVPTLEFLKDCQTPAKIVLGLRDILDRPDLTRELWEREGVYEAIERYYDEVFFYGRREIFATGSHYGLDGASSPPKAQRYCGYICASEPRTDKSQIRQELDLKADKLVVVTVGGGRDGYPLMQACLEAIRLLGPSVSMEALFVTGPLMPAEQRAALRKQAHGLAVRVQDVVTDNLSYVNAADLVVSMAGYNSLSEAVHLGKNVLVVPRKGPSAEQTLRAALFARMGLIRMVNPDDLSPSVLAKALLDSLHNTPTPSVALRADGLTNVVGEMRRLLSASHPELMGAARQRACTARPC